MNLGKVFNYSEPQFLHLKMGVGGKSAYLSGVMWAVVELMGRVFPQTVLREGAAA